MEKISILLILSVCALTKAQHKNSSSTTVYEQREVTVSVETENNIQWKIEQISKKIDRYNLQKATAIFGGKSWTAWFTTDLAVSEGLSTFKGLPGAILYLEDNEKDFVYKKNLKGMKTNMKTTMIS